MSMITVVGNIVRDPETKKGDKYNLTKFRLASNERVKDANGNWKDGDTTYVDVVCWSRLADSALSLKKGQRVIVNGRFKGRDFVRNDGTNGYAYEIVADEIGTSIVKNGQSAKSANNVEILPDLDNPWGE